jgi:hypothetical protein
MADYTTLSDATNDLRQRGFTVDFELNSDHLAAKTPSLKLHPEDFEIKEVYRFEGVSNPSDMSVVYAVEANDGTKGQLVDAYGTYAHNVTPEMAAKLERQFPQT